MTNTPFSKPGEAAKRELFFQTVALDRCKERSEALCEHAREMLAKTAQPLGSESLFVACPTSNFRDLRPLSELSSFHGVFSFSEPLRSPDAVRYGFRQFAPLMRIEGAHLAGISQLRDAHHKSGSAVLRLHSRMVGDGDFQRGRGYSFDTDLRRAGVALPDLSSPQFSSDLQTSGAAFDLPLLLLAFAERPLDHYSHTLGAALFLTLIDPPGLLGAQCELVNSTLRKACRKRDFDDLREAILEGPNFVRDFSITGVEQGFAAAKHLFKELIESIEKALGSESLFSIQNKLIRVLERIGSCPHGYHKRGRMGGQPIDHWFAPENFNPTSVLKALAKSPYIVPGSPEKSRLLTELTKPTGPMFRIFSDDELGLIGEWITTLGSSREVGDCGKPMAPLISLELPSNRGGHRRSDVRIPTARDLYFRLVNFQENAESWEHAYCYASNWLNLHSRNVSKGITRIPFTEFSEAEFDRWLSEQHARQMQGYRPLIGDPEETRAEVIHDALQLAPLTSIDGAWLRGFTAPSLVSTRIGSILYNIYVDELGNGDTTLHHGNIYADLIRSMGHELPPFDSMAFARSALFEDASFEVPVFWLSVSLFPRCFTPEILGLNLAMELSGVGGEYRRSAEVLTYFGFSAQFTTLHNSIDNISSGHTRWAADAIKHHIEQVRGHCGDSGVDDQWKRIWIGYRSLRPPRKRSRLSKAVLDFIS